MRVTIAMLMLVATMGAKAGDIWSPGFQPFKATIVRDRLVIEPHIVGVGAGSFDPAAGCKNSQFRMVVGERGVTWNMIHAAQREAQDVMAAGDGDLLPLRVRYDDTPAADGTRYCYVERLEREYPKQ